MSSESWYKAWNFCDRIKTLVSGVARFLLEILSGSLASRDDALQHRTPEPSLSDSSSAFKELPPMSIAPVAQPREMRPQTHPPEMLDDEKDIPLRNDIRLLGRILGDTVREQEGSAVFEIVERIRQSSIRFHRDNEVGARRELEAILDSGHRR